VAEADVYIAYGREEQAEDILKEALRQQPDRHPVRVKLLEIYARRSDKASFDAVATELRERTGGAGEDWERAAKLGRSIDPSNPLYAGSAAADAATRGPTTDLRVGPAPGTIAPAGAAAPATLRAASVAAVDLPVDTGLEAGVSALVAPTASANTHGSMIDTAMPVDSQSAPLTAQSPTQAGATSTKGAPASLGAIPFEVAPVPVAATAGTIDPFGATTSGIDFGALDFDLGPSKMPVSDTRMPFDTHVDVGPDAEPTAPEGELSVLGPRTDVPSIPGDGLTDIRVDTVTPRAEIPTIPDLDLSFPNTGPLRSAGSSAGAATAAGYGMMPNLDLNLPSRLAPEPTAASFGDHEDDLPPLPSLLEPNTVGGPTTGGAFGTSTVSAPMPAPVSAASIPEPQLLRPPANPMLDDVLSRPTLLGAVGALPDEQAPRLTSNTDQATVPLIDFDLSGADLETTGRHTETQAGTPLAGQMATKLDLARGYIDLGVKDGARELLEEVMREGTREQRQQAVELIKLVEA